MKTNNSPSGKTNAGNCSKNVAAYIFIILLIFLIYMELECINISLSPITSQSWKVAVAIPSEKYDPSNRPIHMLVLQENDQSQDAIELCSIYSVANSNPTRPVYIHSRHNLPESYLWTKTLKNVIIKKIDDSTICKDTPAAEFYQVFLANHFNTSVHRIAEMSDLLRSCVIFKQGGTYIDSDIFLLKPFPDGYRNFIPEEQGQIMCSAFDLNPGDLNLKTILGSLQSGYTPGKWGSIGPIAFQKVYNRNMTNVQFLPEHVFYPIGWGEILDLLVDESKANAAFERIKEHNDTIGIHVYRAMFAFYNRNEYSARSALGILMRENCFPVYAAKIEGHFKYRNFIVHRGG